MKRMILIPVLALGIEALEWESSARAQGERAPAKIIVTIPAQAQLWVGNRLTRSTGTRRALVSPPLEPGKEYYYILKAGMRRNGKWQEEKVEVSLFAGRTSRVTIELTEEPKDLPPPEPTGGKP